MHSKIERNITNDIFLLHDYCLMKSVQRNPKPFDVKLLFFQDFTKIKAHTISSIMPGKKTTEHILSTCKVVLSQGRYTWQNQCPYLGSAKHAFWLTQGKGTCINIRRYNKILVWKCRWHFQRKSLLVAVMTGSFQTISLNGTNILNSSKTQE
ncbi:hypothetical protein PoB_002361500 [Plakobranchus ocellatus]|uniref:FLYWCH-type domain-containing protein n=1 Tax=Plakobranchus ocellatus TaxID=259542 RepID=A0AAV3ZPM3_9GAST|nr:hypothetical protein PoB_002361500 [Plakobranchus ocellatus]